MHNGKAAALSSHSCLCVRYYTALKRRLLSALSCGIKGSTVKQHRSLLLLLLLLLLPPPLPSSSSVVDTTTPARFKCSAANKQQKQSANICVYIDDVFLLLGGDYHTPPPTPEPPPFMQQREQQSRPKYTRGPCRAFCIPLYVRNRRVDKRICNCVHSFNRIIILV